MIMTHEELLQPQAVFDCFAQINRIPRPSKREEKIIDFLRKFGEGLGLETKVDDVGNVVIRKPAAAGFEHLPTVILQSHMDMVCEKEADKVFDFDNDPIETYIDGEWLRARGTTLGADDGIGMAIEMAILQDNSLKHGPIECVFTRDEETGLTGAAGMKSGFMTGRYLINLDSEDEGQIFVSCAGGVRTEAWFPIVEEFIPRGYYFFKASVGGLTGGHSGDDINKRRANANKILLRFLCAELEKGVDLRLVNIHSGGLHNAIPRDGYAICAVPMESKETIAVDANVMLAAIQEEFRNTEPGLTLSIDTAPAEPTAMKRDDAERMLKSLYVVHNGILEMDQDMEGLVQTSSNLASIHTEGRYVKVTTSQRSSLTSARDHMAAMVRTALQLGGARVDTNEGYPGWKLNPDSKLLKATKDSYMRVFNKEPKILAIHAGLECGLFSEKYPEIDMISFGPTLRGVHSPDEKLHIPSVKMVWDHLLDLLVHIE